MSHGPPSRMVSILPSRSCRTCAAVVGDGFVDAFAEGAARGTLAAWIRASASSEEGIRTANVAREAVTCGASGEGLGRGRRMVRAPGQKRAMRRW